MPGLSVREQYSLGTNVNTTFFQVPTLEFGPEPVPEYKSGRRRRRR